MPIFQWFSQNTNAAHTRTGARVSVYFAGRFYDNLYARQRGGATNGSISQKFDFNKGDPFWANAEMPSVGEININGNGADSTYVRQPLSFDTHRQAGVASCISELWQLRDNGSNDRVGVFIEQVDEDFLDRNGYDPRRRSLQDGAAQQTRPGLQRHHHRYREENQRQERPDDARRFRQWTQPTDLGAAARLRDRQHRPLTDAQLPSRALDHPGRRRPAEELLRLQRHPRRLPLAHLPVGQGLHIRRPRRRRHAPAAPLLRRRRAQEAETPTSGTSSTTCSSRRPPPSASTCGACAP